MFSSIKLKSLMVISKNVKCDFLLLKTDSQMVKCWLSQKLSCRLTQHNSAKTHSTACKNQAVSSLDKIHKMKPRLLSSPNKDNTKWYPDCSTPYKDMSKMNPRLPSSLYHKNKTKQKGDPGCYQQPTLQMRTMWPRLLSSLSGEQ